MNAITVATFNGAEKAEALKERFEQTGIHALVHDETNLQRYGFMTHAQATHKVQVADSDFLKARQILNIWDERDHVLDSAVTCPQCHSPRVEYPQFTRKFMTPVLMEMFVSLGLFPKEYYCIDCQYTWPNEPEVRPETDLLGWPTGREKEPAANTVHAS
jgi:hypothetical protein